MFKPPPSTPAPDHQPRKTGRKLRHALALAGLTTLCSFVAFAQSAPASSYDQPYRPQFHFSPRENWTNDPNGLIYFDGEYHLFFQYNPFGDQWGHMTWGHAVSPDLFHWQQLPAAIPEENGIMIFTGSTVVDARNSSGFCQNGKPCLIAVYTGHTPSANGRPALQTQNLAYSNDRGRHWTKYSGNPVLDLHMADFRDPKVFWSQPSSTWVMLVSLPNDHRIRIYNSKDLKHWSAVSDFGPQGAAAGQWECPELFEVPVEGSTKTRWVLKVGLNPGALQGGSGEQYFIGSFDGKEFHNDNPSSTTLWTDYGKDCYCALTFNNLPATAHPIMLGWMDNWQYAKDLPTHPWRGQMTAPRSLSLRQTPDGLRLAQTPVDQLESLYSGAPRHTNGSLDAVNRWLAKNAAGLGMGYRITATIPVGSSKKTGLRIRDGAGHFTTIAYDRQLESLLVDRTQSGLTNFNKDFPARVEAPLKLANQPLHLDILVDRNSVEVFAGNNGVASTNLIFPPATANGVELYNEGGGTGTISLEIVTIRSAMSPSK